MKTKILKIMSEVFEMDTHDFPSIVNQEEIDVWDSLRHLNLIVELEEAFEVSYDPEEISQMTSLDKILEVTNSKKS